MIHLLNSRYELAEYLFTDLDGVDTIFMPVKKHNPLLHRIVKAIYYKVCPKVYSYYLDADINERLRNIPPDDTLIVIGESTYGFWMLSHLCKHVKHKVAYFWNPCVSLQSQKVCREVSKYSDKAKCIVEYIRSLGFTMVTFDEGDAKKYNMAYFPQFYRKPKDYDGKAEIKRDFFFCGRDKGRKDTIDFFKRRLSKFGKCDFNVIPENQVTDAIDYWTYLDIIKGAKALCEISQNGQTGLTIRALEALFLQKKLITNNPSAPKWDFYNPHNILVLTENTTEDELKSFLEGQMVVVESSIIQKHDVSSLLKFLANTPITV